MDYWRASVSYEEILELLEAHLRKKGVKQGRIVIHVDVKYAPLEDKKEIARVYATVEH